MLNFASMDGETLKDSLNELPSSPKDAFGLFDFETYLAKISTKSKNNPFLDVDPFECESSLTAENQIDSINLFTGNFHGLNSPQKH
jgi:hypothetical protein